MVEGRGAHPLFCPRRASLSPSRSGKAGLHRAEGQMADGRPHQCYRKMMIRLQGLEWRRETGEACRFLPLIIITALKWICAIPLAAKLGWGCLPWQLVSRQEEIREIRRAGNQEAFKEYCLASQCNALGLTQPTDRHHLPFYKSYIRIFK